ncbi:MAG: hypothetical protein JNJ54_34055 [Myxococcaceae bacterium]|nr:hypothetical protein [Myxococcaceae bacterium]
MALDLFRDVTPDSLDRDGFFCRMSQMATEGNQQKVRWVRARFKEGLALTLLGAKERGFVEVMPGERCWRPIRAKGWDVIHCLWVVGSSKGRGRGDALLELVEARAKEHGRAGVAVVSREQHWVTPRSFFERRGYQVADEADGFVLLTRALKKAAKLPAFVTHDFSARLARHRTGLVVFRAAQCPYLGDATGDAVALARALKVPSKVVEFTSAKQLREQTPTPYGVFAIALDGKLLTSTYELPAALAKLAATARAASLEV